MAKKIFVNLPVKNLEKSKEFFSKLNFKFDKRFCDENACCVIISKDIYAMLLVEKFFNNFTNKKIIDTTKNTEVILALGAESKKEVDEMMEIVKSSGGKETRPSEDHGWMYQRSFEDIDGHLWEIGYMDEKNMPEEMKNKK
ncbi:MAG: VOC family protein [Candidatus Pacearchaeota archaeon]|jgi:hypothetical protein